MNSYTHKKRLSKRIFTIVASTIVKIHDKRLLGITITDIKLSNNMHYAEIYYTVLGASLDIIPNYVTTTAALEKFKGTIRNKISNSIKLRYVPILKFIPDSNNKSNNRIEELLESTRVSDKVLNKIKHKNKISLRY